jgi:DNA invertase Pin-like site-specific DNA recombinase
MRLAGYIRVSTEGQVEAFGKAVQRAGIERYAALSGDVVVEWFEEDGVSGKVEGADRPVMAQIISRADEFDGIIAFDATRIARRLIVQETLIGILWNAGLQVVTSTAGVIEEDSDPTKVLIRQILGVVAEFDHRTTVKRLGDARRAKIRSGGYGGGITRFGMATTGVGKASALVEDVHESTVVASIVAAHSDGLSMRHIARELNRTGVQTKLGGQWSAVQISRILSRNELH